MRFGWTAFTCVAISFSTVTSAQTNPNTSDPGTPIVVLAPEDAVRIYSIGDDVRFEHRDEVEVRPGAVLSLAVDGLREEYSIDETGRGQFLFRLLGLSVEEFVWTADWSGEEGDHKEICYASNDVAGRRCLLEDSNFQVTDYGVNFYVPYDVKESVTITVRHRDRADADDQLTLKNKDYVPSYQPPKEVVSNPDQYRYTEVSDTYALNGYGRWVYVGGESFWVPYPYYSNWVPYVNGYWTWTSDYGWTWVSYDPWGWYTDHYGHWRYHRTYGWVWRSFPRRHYVPHGCTFFFGVGGYVGWYPFHYESWSSGWYRYGYDNGFDDGYWDGYWDGVRDTHYYARKTKEVNVVYNPGVTFVRDHDFFNRDIRSRRMGDGGTSFRWLKTSAREKGLLPGVAIQPDQVRPDHFKTSRDWIKGRSGEVGPETAVIRRRIGDQDLTYTRPDSTLPDSYRRELPDLRDRKPEQNVPVGSVIRRRPSEQGPGGVEIQKPRNDGADVAAPPIVRRRMENGGTEATELPSRRRGSIGTGPRPIPQPQKPDAGSGSGPVVQPPRNGGSNPNTGGQKPPTNDPGPRKPDRGTGSGPVVQPPRNGGSNPNTGGQRPPANDPGPRKPDRGTGSGPVVQPPRNGGSNPNTGGQKPPTTTPEPRKPEGGRGPVVQPPRNGGSNPNTGGQKPPTTTPEPRKPEGGRGPVVQPPRNGGEKPRQTTPPTNTGSAGQEKPRGNSGPVVQPPRTGGQKPPATNAGSAGQRKPETSRPGSTRQGGGKPTRVD